MHYIYGPARTMLLSDLFGEDESALSGCTLDEIGGPRKRFVLWLEWEGFYCDDSLDRPQIVVRDKVVLDRNQAAKDKKVEVGMALPIVRNLAPDCQVNEWQEGDSLEKQRKWLDLCVPFSDVIEPLDGHIAALDLTAHPQPSHITKRLLGQLGKNVTKGLHHGVGPTKWVANLASQYGQPLAAYHDCISFLAPLPVSNLLPVDERHRERLSALGYRTIHDVSMISLETLRGQFQEAAPLIMLAAQGRVSDPVRPLYPPGVLRQSFYFEGLVDDMETLDRALVVLASQIGGLLKGRQSSQIEFRVEGEEETVHSVKRRFTKPVHDVSTALAVLRALLSQCELEVAVTSLHISLNELVPARSVQANLFVSKVEKEASTVVGTLNEVFGDRAVRLAGQVDVPRRQQVLREWRNATGWH